MWLRCMGCAPTAAVRTWPHRRQGKGTARNRSAPAGHHDRIDERVQPVFRVKPGHGTVLREAVEALMSAPGYRPGDYDLLRYFRAVLTTSIHTGPETQRGSAAVGSWEPPSAPRREPGDPAPAG
jgi:hypothetical protein